MFILIFSKRLNKIESDVVFFSWKSSMQRDWVLVAVLFQSDPIIIVRR